MKEFLERLKQRKIVQWAVAYLAGAFALYTGLQTVGEPWGVTDVWLRAAQAAVVVGFLIAVTLAWYHGENGRQRISGPELLIIAGLLLVSGLLGRQFLGDSVEAEVSVESSDANDVEIIASSVPVARSIAVLPFENRGDESRDANFVAGLHDAVMSQLSQIRSVESRSRTSVLAFRESSLTTRGIARELGVAYIVEGGVQRVDDVIQVSVALIEAETDTRIWNQTLRRDLTVAGLLEIQQEIALQVAAGVGAEVTPAERQRLNVEAPENVVAYSSFLEGLSYLSLVEGVGDSPDTRLRVAELGIEAFGRAIELEPDWAPPRFGAGRIHHFLASSGINPPENYARSKQLLDSAIAIDSLYGPAWGSLAFVRFGWERDFDGALEAYDRAVELGVESGWGRGILNAVLGRWDDAVRAYEGAVAENPLSRTIQSQFGFVLFCAGRYEDAVDQMELAIEMRGWDADEQLALSYLKAGRIDDALAQAARLDVPGRWPAGSAYLFAALDSAETAYRYLEHVGTLEPNSTVVRGVAPALAILEGRDAALTYLEETAAVSPESLGYVDCAEEIREFRGDHRYVALMEGIGFAGRGEPER